MITAGYHKGGITREVSQQGITREVPPGGEVSQRGITREVSQQGITSKLLTMQTFFPGHTVLTAKLP